MLHAFLKWISSPILFCCSCFVSVMMYRSFLWNALIVKNSYKSYFTSQKIKQIKQHIWNNLISFFWFVFRKRYLPGQVKPHGGSIRVNSGPDWDNQDVWGRKNVKEWHILCVLLIQIYQANGVKQKEFGHMTMTHNSVVTHLYPMAKHWKTDWTV